MRIKHSLYKVLKYIPLELLIKISSRNIVLPFYHTVSNEKLSHISNLYSIRSLKQFEDDLDYLCRYYEPVSIEELYEIIINRKKKNKACFHLSFDDGLKEVYTNAAPLLQKKGIPATVFVNSDFIDNKALFFRYKVSLIIEKLNSEDYNKEELFKLLSITATDQKSLRDKLLKLNYSQTELIDAILNHLSINIEEFLLSSCPYLTKVQLMELQDMGFTVGSHSMDHPLFNEINLDEQKLQIHESFRKLDEIFNLNKHFFSFPFSDDSVSTELFDWMFAKENVNLSFGISGLKDDYSSFHLHRIPFEESSDSADKIIKSEYLYYLFKWFFRANRIKRK